MKSKISYFLSVLKRVCDMSYIICVTYRQLKKKTHKQQIFCI